MTVNYAVGSLAPFKHEVFDLWLDAVKRLRPAPLEILVASEGPFQEGPQAHGPQNPDYTLIRFEPWIPGYLKALGGGYGEKLLRIGEGREAVRRVFLERPYEWLFFVDSDVEVPPHALEVLMAKHQQTGYKVIQNLIPERNGVIGQVYFGTILIHRDILRLITFFSIAVAPDQWISEDWIFFNILKWHEYLGHTSIPFFRGQLFKARHYIDRSRWVE